MTFLFFLFTYSFIHNSISASFWALWTNIFVYRFIIILLLIASFGIHILVIFCLPSPLDPSALSLFSNSVCISAPLWIFASIIPNELCSVVASLHRFNFKLPKARGDYCKCRRNGRKIDEKRGKRRGGEEGSYCSANTNRETVDKDEQGIEMNRGEAENQAKLGGKS